MTADQMRATARRLVQLMEAHSGDAELQEIAKELVGACMETLKVAINDEKKIALDVLDLLGPFAEAAIPVLQVLLTHSFAWIRKGSVQVLGKIGSAARASLPLLFDRLEEKDELIRGAAVMAIVQIEQDEKAYEVLCRAMKDPSEWVRFQAARSFGYLRAAIRTKTVDTLLKGLDDSDHYVREEAAKSLGKFGTDASQAVPRLIQGLADPDRKVRFECTDALRQIGPAAKTAIPALIALRSVTDPSTPLWDFIPLAIKELESAE